MVEQFPRIVPPSGDAQAPKVVPLQIPHGHCGPACPFCPPEPDEGELAELMLQPGDVAAAMLRYSDGGEPRSGTLLAFYGTPLPALPHGQRAPLLDAAERQFRSGRVDGIRITCDPARLARAPLGEWRARGVRSVEVPLLSTEPRVLREWGVENHPALMRDLAPRVGFDIPELGILLVPGLPGDSHDGAVRTARSVAAMRPAYVRILPAMALEGTRLEIWWRSGAWDPMTLDQAVSTCAAMLGVFRDAAIPVARLGLQPQFDLVRGPRVLEGPYHPSLRQLAESRLFRRTIFEQVGPSIHRGRVILRFHPADESYVRGPMNSTLNEMRKRLGFEDVELIADAALSRGRPEVEVDP